MAQTGKAALFLGPRQFEVRELPVPEVEPGGILVRITAGGVCGSDLHYWRGEFKPFYKGEGPAITGHEMTGVVDTLGPGVSTDSLGQPLKEGDRVVFAYFHPCQRCPVCLRGDLGECPAKFQYRYTVEMWPYCSGGFADYFYLRPGAFIFKAPDDLSDEALTPVNCALAQVVYGLERAGLRMGDAVVVQGAGGLGLYACAVAKEMGAGTVIAIDGVPARLEVARQCGADHTLDILEVPEVRDRVAQVREWTGGQGADVVMEVVGIAAVIPEGLEMLRPGGAYVEIGTITPGATVSVEVALLNRKGVRFYGNFNYHPRVLPRALDFLRRARGKYALDRIVSHKFPLERINEAFAFAEWAGRQKEAQVVRALITPQ